MFMQRLHHLIRGVKLTFTGGRISLKVAFKGPNVILGLNKHNYSLTRGKGLSAAAGSNKVEGRILPAGLVFAACFFCDLPQAVQWSERAAFFSE